MKIVRLPSILVILGLFLPPLATASARDLSEAYEAYFSGEYEEAFQVFRLHAEKGDASSQIQVGMMHRYGLGVPQDNSEAMRWYRLAAEQEATENAAEAKFRIGAMYDQGKGVPQDYVLAHKWMNLAAAQGRYNATEYRKLLESDMTSSQIAEAQKLAREWLAKRD